MAENPGALGALGQPVFRSLWAASLISNTGMMMQLVGAAWLMTQLSSSASMVSLVQASIAFPAMLFSLIAGVLADNHNRRNVLLIAQIFMLIVSLLLTVFAFTELITPWMLLGFTFLIGSGMALNNPSWQASFSDIVERNYLPSAVSMNAMGMNITRCIGPAAGGFVVALAGAASAFAFNTLSYIALIVPLARWKPKRTAQTLPPEGFVSALVAGIRYFALSPRIIDSSIRAFLFGFGAISMQALLPLVARGQLDGDAVTYGILLSAHGLGAVFGALFGAKLRANFTNEMICRVGCLWFAALCLVVAFSHLLIITVVAVFLSGMTWINVMSLINVTVQMSTPRWVLGRIIAIFMSFAWGGMALGSWLWGETVELYGVPVAFVGCALALLLSVVWGLFAPLPQYEELKLDPGITFAQPEMDLQLSHNSGPMLITVEIRIKEQDTAQFLKLMDQRRRIRRRNGARRWSLLRDTADAERWIESYSFPTWAAYIRQIERRTVDEVAVDQQLVELHSGKEPHKVTRMIERYTVAPGSYPPPATDPGI